MKRIAVVAGALLVAILMLGHITGALPETPDTVDIDPGQLEEGVEEVSEEMNEAVGRMTRTAKMKLSVISDSTSLRVAGGAKAPADRG